MGTTAAAAAVAIMAWVGAAVQWQNSVTLGVMILGAVGVLATISILMYGARWKSSSDSYKAAFEGQHAVVESLREGRDAYRLRAERLEEENGELRAHHLAFVEEQREIRHALKNEVAELRLTDMSAVVGQLAEIMRELVEGRRVSEELARGAADETKARHEEILVALQGVTLRLENLNGGPTHA